MTTRPWETIWNRLHSEVWTLGRVRAVKELVGVVWIVDATHYETGRRYAVEAVTLDLALERIEAWVREGGTPGDSERGGD